MDLKNKIAVVTGGSSGIGQAISIALAKEGCNVVFTYNSSEKGADETMDKCEGKGFKLKVDLQKKEDVKTLFDYVKEKFKNLDILVNNAGIEVLSDDQLDLDVWKTTFETDLFWAVTCSQKAIEIMKNEGRIINISSGYGEENMGYVGSIAYSSAKSALNSFTKTLAKKLAPKINVNAISPGYVDTPMWKVTSDEEKKVLGKDQLIGRFIKSNEISDITIAVIKNDAITGEVVIIDGGLSLKTV